MKAFEFVDFYETAAAFDENEKQIRNSVRAFVDTECMPIIADCFDRGKFPMDLIPRMSEMGLFGIHVEGYGCQKRSHLAYGLICQELGRCDSGLRAMFSVQNSLVMFPIYEFGSDSQRETWLPKLASAEAIGCFGLSEPEYGSNPAGMITTARKTNGHYVLNGKKMWITNGTIADVAVIWAKLDGDIRGFLVETGTPGFRANPIQRKFSYRTSPTAFIDLRDCEIPESNILPAANGLKSVFQCLNHARYGVACGAIGSSIACYEAARNFAMERQVFDRPVGSYQLVQDCLARMLIEITKGQLVNLQLGRMLDA